MRWVVAFDAARIGPSLDGGSGLHYGIGPGIQFNIVTFQVTLGYSFRSGEGASEAEGTLARSSFRLKSLICSADAELSLIIGSGLLNGG